MNNPVHARIDDKLLKLLDSFCDKHHWKTSRAIREILTLFFKNELSDNAG